MKSVNCDLKRLCECSRHYQYFVWQGLTSNSVLIISEEVDRAIPD